MQFASKLKYVSPYDWNHRHADIDFLHQTLIATSLIAIYSLYRQTNAWYKPSEKLLNLRLRRLRLHPTPNLQSHPPAPRSRPQQGRHSKENTIHSIGLRCQLSLPFLHSHASTPRPSPLRVSPRSKVQTMADSCDQLEGMASVPSFQFHSGASLAVGGYSCLVLRLFQHILELYEVRRQEAWPIRERCQCSRDSSLILVLASTIK